MNINSKNFATQPAGVSSVSDPKLFDSFNDTDCSAAIWARDVPLDKQAWINELERTVLPTGRVIIPTNLVTETVTNLFDISGLPPGPNRTWFERDITSLATIFSEVVKSKYLRLRFNVVETCMCPKFHIDSITARLICTYRGLGTQYGISERGEDPKHVYTPKLAFQFCSKDFYGQLNQELICL